MIKNIKKSAVWAACVCALPIAPLVAIAFYFKEKENLLNAWHPLTPIMEPICVGIAWPYFIAVEKGFIEPFGPTAEEIEQERKQAVEKEERERNERKKPVLLRAKNKEKQIRENLIKSII
jgi:hypothetical protein